MKAVIIIIMTSVCVAVPVIAQEFGQEYRTVPPKVRFVSMPVYIDSGESALAAYQFELKTTAGRIEIVGIENGEHPAFNEPPYYDPAALANDRVIIAAFDTGDNLPVGRTRVTTIQLQILGDIDPQYELDLTVAADSDGNEIAAEITY